MLESGAMNRVVTDLCNESSLVDKITEVSHARFNGGGTRRRWWENTTYNGVHWANLDDQEKSRSAKNMWGRK